jgi:hypothetical protein
MINQHNLEPRPTNLDSALSLHFAYYNFGGDIKSREGRHSCKGVWHC